MAPVTPSVTTSPTDPRRRASTSVPHAIASIITDLDGSLIPVFYDFRNDK
jgi:hypothetical protein